MSRLGGWLPQEAREGSQGAQGLELWLELDEVMMILCQALLSFPKA